MCVHLYEHYIRPKETIDDKTHISCAAQLVPINSVSISTVFNSQFCYYLQKVFITLVSLYFWTENLEGGARSNVFYIG